jgi:hypothetical protein
MPMKAPISHHLDLYRYWLAKRASRTMPARSDISPGDFPALLPYLGLVNKVDDQFRWRLVGTAAVREIGRDLTGSIVGSYNSSPGSAAALQSIFERAFESAHPVFATGEHKTKWGIHNLSLLVLPLSDDETTVNMAVLTRVARYNFDVRASTDWLKGLPIRLRDVIDIDSAAELEKRCLDWERHCNDQRRRADGNAHPTSFK